MTAEIAILNNSGIALAADSAVTIGDQKVYNSANKLFTLSKHHPIGIMVYDSADFMGVPWEIIIKEFRAELGENSFDTLSEYSNKFWGFIINNSNIIQDSSKENYILAQVHTYLDIIYKEIESNAAKEIQEHGETTLEKSLETFERIIEEHGEIILNADYADDLGHDDAGSILKERRDEFSELALEKLGNLYNELGEDRKKFLLELISNVFVRDRLILKSSGVVIAGYGDKEMYPRIASYEVEGIINKKIRKVFREGKSNIQNEVVVTAIIPFAQDEMVWTFMTGIDPEIEDFSERYLTEIFRKYPEYIDKDEYGLDDDEYKKLKGSLRSGGVKLFDDFRSELANFQRRNNTQPILDMVGVLPKDELAAMAESLVNLTVFKRKVSKTVETVGGPIDVAVISKGDGFIWVKRKHYFKPELNQHFFANYFRR